MINKKVNTVQEALEGIENGMTLMLGGLAFVEFQKIAWLNW
jgi:acyl CoA:acetate/3-ketoacid CoA transferase alpha subunit